MKWKGLWGKSIKEVPIRGAYITRRTLGQECPIHLSQIADEMKIE